MFDNLNTLSLQNLIQLEADVALGLSKIRQALADKRRAQSRDRSKQRKSHLAEVEASAVLLLERVKIGDFVRVAGVRDARYPWREVAEKSSNSFRGFQYRFDKMTNQWIRGSEYTTHMSNKIREMIRQEDVVPTAQAG